MPFPGYRDAAIYLKMDFAQRPEVRRVLATGAVEEALASNSGVVPVKCRVLEDYPERGDLLLRVIEDGDSGTSPQLFVKAGQFDGGVCPGVEQQGSE
jgi:hypothetical protein